MHGGNVFKASRETGLPLAGLVDYSANVNALGIPEGLKTCLRRGLQEAAYYPDPDYTDLYQSVASFYGVKPEQLYLGNGAAHVIHHAIQLLKPRKAALMSPTFSEYRQALRKTETVVETILLSPADEFRLPIAETLETVSRGCDLLVLCNPNNPTGQRIPCEELQALQEHCRQYRCHLLIDEAFMDFMPSEAGFSMLSKLTGLTHVSVVRAFTKVFAVPGVRLGALVTGDKTLATQLRQDDIPWSINTFAVQLARFLQTEEAVDYLGRTRASTAVELRWIRKALGELPGVRCYESHVNYVLVQLTQPGSSVHLLQQKLLSQGYLIRNCSNYDSLDDTWFRITVKDRETNQRFMDALAETLK